MTNKEQIGLFTNTPTIVNDKIKMFVRETSNEHKKTESNPKKTAA